MKKVLALAPLLVLLLLAACSKERVCAPDETKVNDVCYALRSDPRNCGAVGNACGSAQGCQAGACVDCATSNGACSAAVVAACYNLSQVRPLTSDLAPANIPLITDAGPISFAPIGDTLWVANSLSSSLSAVKLSPPSSTSGADSLKVPSAGAAFVDLEKVTARNGLLWVSNSGTNSLVVVDPARGPVDEILLSTPSANEFPNPQGLDFVGTKGYLALAGVDALAVLDLSSVPGRVVSRIDLKPSATAGTNAGPSRVLAVGARVYVSLNNLFDATFTPVPGAHGRLAVVDPATDAVTATVDLGPACQNASGLALSGTKLWVACGFFDQFGSGGVSGAALVPVELSGAAPVSEAPVILPNAATSLAACGGGLYAGASDTGTVLRLDLASGSLTSALACPAAPGLASFVPDLACPL